MRSELGATLYLLIQGIGNVEGFWGNTTFHPEATADYTSESLLIPGRLDAGTHRVFPQAKL